MQARVAWRRQRINGEEALSLPDADVETVWLAGMLKKTPTHLTY